ncbi:hypothetical protein B296_00044688, partial [Ensete ventricosum]
QTTHRWRTALKPQQAQHNATRTNGVYWSIEGCRPPSTHIISRFALRPILRIWTTSPSRPSSSLLQQCARLASRGKVRAGRWRSNCRCRGRLEVSPSWNPAEAHFRSSKFVNVSFLSGVTFEKEGEGNSSVKGQNELLDTAGASTSLARSGHCRTGAQAFEWSKAYFNCWIHWVNWNSGNAFKVVALAAGSNVARHPDAATVVTGIVGCAGLKPTVAAIEAGKDIALANKETLIAGGPFVLPLAHKHKVKILPADSEHSAVFQIFLNWFLFILQDSSVLAQLGWPDMRLPILYTLSWPDRIACSEITWPRLDLCKFVTQLLDSL